MPRTRKQKLEEVTADGVFDALVVGGGINGIGVFRELALQGLRVLLVERSDFCSGCSAAPSRMIHGGLRYLENGEFSLVRELLDERDRLLASAPHLVRPLPTTIPIVGIFSGMWNSVVGIFGGDGKPSHRGAVPIRLGLGVYDWLTRKRRAVPRHEFRGREATRALWPRLSRQMRFSATYYDAWISHPERLGLEIAADTEEMASQCVALNYVTLSRRTDDVLELVDATDGSRRPVSAGVIVNATGAWLDDTRSELAAPDAANDRMVEGTKGSHLILDNPSLLAALGGNMLYFENPDRRVCIAFPYLGRVLAGSTDIRVDKATRVRCEDDERDYILSSLRRLFPDIPIGPGDIVFSFSGIRPLPRSNHAFTGRISRGHFTRRIDGSPPQICMVGGKWTTFRAFAEQAAGDALAELGKPRVHDSATLAIGGGRCFPTDRQDLVRRFQERFGLEEVRAIHLVDHYGTNGAAVQAYCDAHAGDAPLAPGCAYTTFEIDYLVRNEQAVHFGDVALRRTDLAITGQLSPAVVDALVKVTGAALGWDDARAEAERASFIAEMHDYYGVSLERAPQLTDRREECV